jgi:hypothetical protein
MPRAPSASAQDFDLVWFPLGIFFPYFSMTGFFSSLKSQIIYHLFREFFSGHPG